MRKDERGIALLTVTIVSVLLLLLGLSMTFTSMTDFSMSNELENKKRAVLIAEAGVNALKDTFRGSDISAILAATTAVPQYINYPEPNAGTDAATYFNRNPLAHLEAMNVDFENLPTQIGTRTVNGFLTPAGGVPFGTGGRYWAKTTDNDDGDGDLTVDTDKTVYLRVVGIQRNSGGQVSIYGGNVQNSIAIIEATLKRDRAFAFNGAFTFYGADILPMAGANILEGAAYDIDGYDHPAMTLADLVAGNHSHVAGGDSAGINAINEPNASTLVNTLLNEPPLPNTVIGNTASPSIEDVTSDITSNPDVDADNILDATYVMNFIENLEMQSLVDITLADGANYSGDLGSDADPKITVAEGDVRLGGGGSGAGLLIVKGRLDFVSNYDYRGLVLVVGDGEFDLGGGPVGILGGVFLANTIDNGDDTYSYGLPSFTIRGPGNFYFQSSAIDLALDLTPMKTIVWREITRAVEPPY